MTATPPPHPPVRIPLIIVEQCLAAAEYAGLQRELLLRDAGFTLADLAAAGGWLSFAQVEPVIRLGIERLQDPLIGLHTSPRINLATLGVLGYAIQTSSTLKDLIETNMRFERLLGDVGTTTLGHEPGVALWQWEGIIQDPLVARHTHECILGCWAGMLRLMKQREPRALLAVRFQHDAPADLAAVRDTEKFFGCPVHYSQPCSALVLLPAALNAPLTLANPDLHMALEQHAQQLLRERQTEPNLLLQARKALLSELRRGDVPTRESLAAQLGMSGRSLHRKLQELDSSFRDLLDSVRFDLATEHLRDHALSVDAVASKLGFQESQSFIRWFKRLAGTTPGDYRLQQRL
ncbi:MAG TPA: AraC family transcriptional regulator [Moraxellaceae bacterium]